MIYEYALEPELVAGWGSRQDFRYFVEQFGLGQVRVVSRYPGRWARLVWRAFHSADDMDRTRMVELLQRLTEKMVRRRDYLWDPERTWVENVRVEDERIPFHAIVARTNQDGHERIIAAGDVDHAKPLWAVPRGRRIARKAADMAAAVSAVLHVADVVVFVDPHFRPEDDGYQRPFEAFLRGIVAGRPSAGPRRVEILALVDDRSATHEFFERECRRCLPRFMPAGLSLRIVRLQERPRGEELHNRYILTDLGGIQFGAGLDEGSDGSTDDLQVLDTAQYRERWQQYVGDARAFDEPEPPIEIG